MTNPPTQEECTTCPGCGLRLPAAGLPADYGVNASAECRQLSWELSADTLSRRDQAFIHQLAVDVYAAQHAGGASRPITTAFALVGLYLACERDFAGRDVQRAHVLLAELRMDWPHFAKPEQSACMTVADVLRASPGEQRDRRLRDWAASIWETWQQEREHVVSLANRIPS